MKVIVGFVTYVSLIEFNPFLGEKIEDYIKEFYKWYYEIDETGKIVRKSCHSHYEYLDLNVIIDWIKDIAPEANPVILIERARPDDVDPSLPGMYL